jgi:Kef-type K+ transport system membrane component KefB
MPSSPSPSSVNGVEHVLLVTLVQLAIIVVAARIAGNLAKRIGQPRAVGEIVAGLMLGPSALGVVAPETFRLLFRSTDSMPISILSQLGLIMLMFQIGLQFDFAHLRAKGNSYAVGLVSALGILAPLGIGIGFGHLSAPYLAPGVPTLSYALFMGAAFAITAVPVLGRIMIEFGLTRTRVGVIAISAAAVNDVAGWTMLACISAAVTAHFSLSGMLRQVALLLVYFIVCWFIARPVLRFIVHRFDFSAHRLPHDLMATILVSVLISAMLTSTLGIFAVFGGLMVGVLLHDQRTLVEAWNNKVADLVTVLFLPIFFTYTGLRTTISGLDSPDLWLWCAGLMGLAILGKFGGCYVGARLAGLETLEARNVAIMMNTRGLMELIILNVGFDLGFIPEKAFTMFVLTALVSTAMTAPGLRVWLPRMQHVIPVAVDA